MNLTRLLLMNLWLGVAGCAQPSDANFSPLQPRAEADFLPGFRAYCEMDTRTNFEQNAVLCSFYGDYEGALAFATRDARVPEAGPQLQIPEEQAAALRAQLNQALRTGDHRGLPTVAAEDPESAARQLLGLLEGPASPQEAFAGHRMQTALDYIVEQADNYHFTLINEAHYSGRHRAFTRSLLRPLWEKGYRYLALETLGYQDSLLTDRGYPVFHTGYYLRESTFGNLVREALAIGYHLVPYEVVDTRRDVDTFTPEYNTYRDSMQALNLYKRTWKQDTTGKVLVHVGYDHLFESGDRTHRPMGAQMRKLAGREILTTDQETMTWVPDERKLHPYHRYALETYELEASAVFLDESGQPLLDPIARIGMDVQVYHPPAVYRKGRPAWRITGETRLIPLPDILREKEDYLLQVVPAGEAREAVPVDQFVISRKKALVLAPGRYKLRLIDCAGTLRGVMEVEVE